MYILRVNLVMVNFCYVVVYFNRIHLDVCCGLY